MAGKAVGGAGDGGRRGTLGVGVSGIGWCASEHIKAFLKNPHTEVRVLHGRDEGRVREKLAKYGVSVPHARFRRSRGCPC